MLRLLGSFFLRQAYTEQTRPSAKLDKPRILI